MSLQRRAQQFETKAGDQIHGDNGQNKSISTFNEPRPWGIVDGELVEVLSQDSDIPGMSPGYWVRSDEDGTNAPVSYKDIKVFSNNAAARQALNMQQLSGTSSGRTK